MYNAIPTPGEGLIKGPAACKKALESTCAESTIRGKYLLNILTPVQIAFL